LVALLLLALAVRLAPYPTARADGDWFLADGDSYYHLRRIEQTIERGGRVPMFDPWLSYPEGQRIQWHAGYDLLVAGAVALACGTTPDRPCLTTTAVVSTPLLGMLATLVVFLLGRALIGTRRGLLAAALFATYPFSAGSAAIGHVDHHVLEPLLVAAWLWAWARGHPTVSGAIAGLSFAVFPSALMPVGATVGGLAISRMAELRRDPRPDWAGFRFALAATLVLLPVVWSGAFADRWEPAATSLFHLAAMLLGLGVLALIESCARWGATQRTALAALILLALLALALAWPRLEPLWRFGQTSGLWRGVVQQVPWGRGPLAAALPGLLVVGACLFTARNAARRKQPGLQLTALVALPLTLCGMLQIRFLMMASAPLVIVIADTLASAHKQLEHLGRQPPRARRIARLLSAALALLALVPLLEYRRSARAPDPRLLAGTRLLKRLARGDAPRPGAERGAVLARWIWGHHVLFLAQRPTVASPFILTGRDRANVETEQALSAGGPAVLRLMRSRRCDHVLTSSALLGARRGGAGASDPLHLVDAEGSLRLYRRVDAR
jgi:dolichyl-diphosphooligosaccharide--protein glycosyltransferase